MVMFATLGFVASSCGTSRQDLYASREECLRANPKVDAADSNACRVDGSGTRYYGPFYRTSFFSRRNPGLGSIDTVDSSGRSVGLRGGSTSIGSDGSGTKSSGTKSGGFGATGSSGGKSGS